jgi:hypothetical protein
MGKQNRMNKTMLTYYIWLNLFPDIISEELVLPVYYKGTCLNLEDIWTENKTEMINDVIHCNLKGTGNGV